jgi:beta-glucanase (GH16 family)
MDYAQQSFNLCNGWLKTHFEKNTEPGQGWNMDFHHYQVEWTPENIKFSVDDQELGIVNIPDGGMWKVGHFNSYLGPEVESPWEGEASNAPFDREFSFL